MCNLLIILLTTATSHAAQAPTYPPNPGETPPALGETVPNVRLFDVIGRRHELARPQAECVVIVFWAFWCDTWKKALPALSDIARHDKELPCDIRAVSIDGRLTAQVRPLVSAGRVPFPLLIDDGSLSRQLHIRRVPTVLVIDRRRQVVKAWEGYPGNEALSGAVREVLGREP